MLKCYNYVYTLPTIFFHAYVDGTYGRISARSIQNARMKRMHVETLCIPV